MCTSQFASNQPLDAARGYPVDATLSKHAIETQSERVFYPTVVPIATQRTQQIGGVSASALVTKVVFVCYASDEPTRVVRGDPKCGIFGRLSISLCAMPICTNRGVPSGSVR